MISKEFRYQNRNDFKGDSEQSIRIGNIIIRESIRDAAAKEQELW